MNIISDGTVGSACSMAQMLNIDDLKEDYLICDVCGDEYDEDHREPRVLPCLHTFCNRCLEGMVRDWTLTCPTCRIKHSVPGDRCVFILLTVYMYYFFCLY